MSSARKLTAQERRTYLRLLARTRPCWGRILLAVVFGILFGGSILGMLASAKGALAYVFGSADNQIDSAATAWLNRWYAGGVSHDWIFTAGLMAIFTIVLLIQVIFSKGSIGYDKWAGIFASQWMKVLTFAVVVALIWHIWVGMRNVWMDYIKPVGMRMTLQALTLAWLVGCAGWAFQVLWRL